MKRILSGQKFGLGFFRAFVIYFLVLTFSGVPALSPLVYGAPGEENPPVLRHIPPPPQTIGKTFFINAVVEDVSNIVRVDLWYRETGTNKFRKIPMKKISKKKYEVKVSITKDLKLGVEYFIVAVDQFGNEGTDGSKNKPYLVEVLELPKLPALTSGPTEVGEKTKKPFWKSLWFWLGIAAAGGGVVALTGSGGDNGSGTGTINVN